MSRSRQDVALAVRDIYVEHSKIWATVQRRAFVRGRGWQDHGMPTRVELHPAMLLNPGVADVVADEQYRQEKMARRDDWNAFVADNPELPLAFE